MSNDRIWPYNGAMEVGRIHPANNDPRAPLLSETPPTYIPLAFNFRPPDALMALLRQAARENQRSINAEMIYRLTRSFETYRR